MADDHDNASAKQPLPVRMWQGFWAWAVGVSGSTRSSALLRIAIILCLWTRWGDRFALFGDPSWSTLGLGLAFYLSTFLALIGLWTRPACAIAGLVAVYCHYYLGLHELTGGWGNHHMKLLAISAALLPFTPCGRSYSVDRLLAVRRARREGKPPPPEHGDLWGLRLIGLFLSSLYISTAFHKTNEAWLSGMRMEQIFSCHYLGSTYLDARWWTSSMQALAIGTWAMEWFLPFGLWFRRTRPFAVVGGIAMHALFYAFFVVFTFSMNMIVLYLAVISPQAVHEVLDRLHAGPTPGSKQAVQEAPVRRSAWPMWAAAALVVVYLVAVPLRASLPGVFGSVDEPRDPIHPSSAPWVQLELRPLGADPASPPLDWDGLFDAEEARKKQRQAWPPRIRLIPSEKAIRNAARKTCRHVEPDVQLEQRARMATADGWRELDSPAGDVCRRRPKSKSKQKTKFEPSSVRRPRPQPSAGGKQR